MRWCFSRLLKISMSMEDASLFILFFFFAGSYSIITGLDNTKGGDQVISKFLIGTISAVRLYLAWSFEAKINSHVTFHVPK